MNCKELATSLVCFNDGTLNTTLVSHYEYGKDAVGETILVATRYTDAAGVPVDTSGGVVTAGACALTPPDVEYELLCDNLTTGVIVEFLRRSITSFDSVGVATVVVTDWELDKVTAYAPVGVVSNCNQDCDPAAVRGVLLAWG